MIKAIKSILFIPWCLFDFCIALIIMIPVFIYYRLKSTPDSIQHLKSVKTKDIDFKGSFDHWYSDYQKNKDLKKTNKDAIKSLNKNKIKLVIKRANKKFKKEFNNNLKLKASKIELEFILSDICKNSLEEIYIFSKSKNKDIEKIVVQDWEGGIYRTFNKNIRKHLDYIGETSDREEQLHRLEEFFAELDNNEVEEKFLKNRPGYAHVFSDARFDFKKFQNFFESKREVINRKFD